MSAIIECLISGEIHLENLPCEVAAHALEECGTNYRDGKPVVDDATYDVWIELFASLYPDHPLVTEVEDENMYEGKKVDLPQRMLSTNKAYSESVIAKWVNRCLSAGADLGIPEKDIFFRATPKLDGFACYDDGTELYTRGNGKQGTIITHILDKGVTVEGCGGRGLGPGEIVVNTAYFIQNLTHLYDNTRNFQSSVLADKVGPKELQRALRQRKVVFFPFSRLPHTTTNGQGIIERCQNIAKSMSNSTPFDTDGTVFECTHPDIKAAMGHTSKYHRWMIALKSNDDSVEVEIQRVVPQTSRTGKLTPVAVLPPTRLSGAEITRVTAHHYGMVRDMGIGRGTFIKLVRSGLVIPKIDAVVHAALPEIPKTCPCCDTPVVWIEDNLVCPNHADCRDQVEKKIIHFFEILDNSDGLGPATIATFYDYNVKTVEQVYKVCSNPLTVECMGFGDKTAANLVGALTRSRKVLTDDTRFLAAWGVHTLGMGVAEKILQHHPIEDILTLTVKDLEGIAGIGKITAKFVVDGLAAIRDMYSAVFALGFNLKRTPLLRDAEVIESPIAGKAICFTGSLVTAKREELQKQAKSLGATIAKSVTSKTNMLVMGANVGASKISAADKHGTVKISEADYIKLIGEL